MDDHIEPEADLTRVERARRARKVRDDRASQRLAVLLVGPLATLLVAVILVFFVFFDTSTISGTSMLPTLLDHDYVLLTKGLSDPKRGDIVIVNVSTKGSVTEEWVKRVVGLPGDTVDVRGDAILVNGSPESFRHSTLVGAAAGPIEHIVVPQGRVFVAGDNRPVSEDSRYVGTFSLKAVKGRVVFVYAPITHMGPIAAPAR